MKTTATVSDLSALSDEDFVEHLRKFPKGYQWQKADAWRYANLRLGNIQGLIIETKKEKQ